MNFPRPARGTPEPSPPWPRPARRKKQVKVVEVSWPTPARPPEHYPNLMSLYELLGKHESWRSQALCRIENVPLEKFFPWRGQSQAEAKDTCMRCPVRAECTEFAQENDVRGIWGGAIYSR